MLGCVRTMMSNRMTGLAEEAFMLTARGARAVCRLQSHKHQCSSLKRHNFRCNVSIKCLFGCHQTRTACKHADISVFTETTQNQMHSIRASAGLRSIQNSLPDRTDGLLDSNSAPLLCGLVLLSERLRLYQCQQRSPRLAWFC
jgi:hypothetical protein